MPTKAKESPREGQAESDNAEPLAEEQGQVAGFTLFGVPLKELFLKTVLILSAVVFITRPDMRVS